MSENVAETAAPNPTPDAAPRRPRKAAAKKTAAKRASKAPAKSEGQVVFLVGSSRGGKHGDRRTVSPERAEQMVAAGLARYPASKE